MNPTDFLISWVHLSVGEICFLNPTGAACLAAPVSCGFVRVMVPKIQQSIDPALQQSSAPF